jgi:hypothetical protein
MPVTTAPPPPLPVVTTLDDVVEALDTVIRWSTDAASRLGYFAALYKRITVAVRQAIADGAFEDGPRMELFDVAFAARYLDALNGHFHPVTTRDPPDPGRSASMPRTAASRFCCSTCWPG